MSFADHQLVAFRAKPAPKPNLIERFGNTPSTGPTSQAVYKALLAVQALIATMQGGDPDLWAAYEGAIE